jgi:hypothetical protein
LTTRKADDRRKIVFPNKAMRPCTKRSSSLGLTGTLPSRTARRSEVGASAVAATSTAEDDGERIVDETDSAFT